MVIRTLKGEGKGATRSDEVFVFLYLRSTTYRVLGGRLGPTRLFGDNNLVDGKHCACGLGGELDGPRLGGEEVENAMLAGVKGTRVVVVLRGGRWKRKSLALRFIRQVDSDALCMRHVAVWV